jgi:hypothetical protein
MTRMAVATINSMSVNPRRPEAEMCFGTEDFIGYYRPKKPGL